MTRIPSRGEQEYGIPLFSFLPSEAGEVWRLNADGGSWLMEEKSMTLRPLRGHLPTRSVERRPDYLFGLIKISRRSRACCRWRCSWLERSGSGDHLRVVAGKRRLQLFTTRSRSRTCSGRPIFCENGVSSQPPTPHAMP